MGMFDKPKKKVSGAEMHRQEESLKRSLSFIILILMVLSLTMCSTPSYEEFENGSTPEPTAQTNG